jgi:hypothetical protein
MPRTTRRSGPDEGFISRRARGGEKLEDTEGHMTKKLVKAIDDTEGHAVRKTVKAVEDTEGHISARTKK